MSKFSPLSSTRPGVASQEKEVILLRKTRLRLTKLCHPLRLTFLVFEKQKHFSHFHRVIRLERNLGFFFLIFFRYGPKIDKVLTYGTLWWELVLSEGVNVVHVIILLNRMGFAYR